MVKSQQSEAQHQPSVKLRAKPLKGPSFEIFDLADVSDVQLSCDDNNHRSNTPNSRSSEMLSTAELISAVGQIWDCASRSLARLQPRAGANYSYTVNLKDNEPCYLVGNDTLAVNNVIDSGQLHVDLNSCSFFPCIVNQSLEVLRLTQKIQYVPCEDHFIRNFIWKILHRGSARNGVRGIPYALMNRYRWMTQIYPQQAHFVSSSRELTKNTEPLTSEGAVSECCPESGIEQTSSRNTGAESLGSLVSTPNSEDLSLGASSDNIICEKSLVSPLSSASSMEMESKASIFEPGCYDEASQNQFKVDDLVKNELKQSKASNTRGELQRESFSSVMDKSHPFLAKQEHAVSGALAGIFVSLCLHPIDTVKTVVQSCQAGQKSLRHIGKSIITARGFPGLYRGLGSNITLSAPISAVYTFTYESVKGILLPSLAKEYHAVAHCTAGACASIATSFIFTPSEHVKQQMQVNPKNQNCWTTALRIIEKGGLLSLYAGWRAVLCRNIPHSIIKFYTYESMKQMFMSSEPLNKQPETLQTLICGGLAGSAAALFSTPFDVVKTRLQTQMPGSARRYRSILDALQEIREHEGVKGLYRGLIPRLVMYMSQGALFFASYEFFKSLSSLKLCQDELELQSNRDIDDDPLFPL